MSQSASKTMDEVPTLELLCSIANIPHIVVAKPARIVKMNRAAFDWLKTNDVDLTNSTVDNSFPPEIAEMLNNMFPRLEARNTHEITHCITCKDFSVIPLRMIGIHPANEDDIHIFLVPITDQREIAEMVNDEEMQYRLIFEHSGTAMCMFGDNGIITRCNRKFEELVGFAKKEIEGIRQLEDFITPEDFERMAAYHHLRSEKKGDPPSEYNFEMYNRRGEILHIHMSISVNEKTMERIASMIDITKWVSAEHELMSQKVFFEQIIENLPIGVYVKHVDDDFRFIVWNRELEKIIGLPREQAIGRNDHDINPDRNLADQYRQSDLEVIRQREVDKHDEVYIKTKYKSAWVSTKKVPIIDTFGSNSYILGLLEDITMRKLSEDMFRVKDAALESSVNGIGIVDMNGIVTYANKAAVWHLGFNDPMQIVGKSINDLFIDREEANRVWDTVNKSGYWNGDVLFKTVQDGKKPLNITTTLVRDKNGDPISIIAVGNDLSEKEMVLGRMRMEQQRIYSILDLLPAHVFIQGADHVLSYANHAFVERYGDFNNRTCHELMMGRNTQCDLCNTDEFLENGQAATFEWHDRDDRQYLIKVIPFEEFDGSKSLLKIAFDITDRDHLNEERIRMQKLDSLGILAGGIAHDFNNLLLIMQGNIEMVMMNTNRLSPEYENLDETVNAVRRAKSLTNQLLTFSQGGAPIFESTSLDELIKDSAYFALRGSKSICSFDHPDDLKNVLADKNQLNQAIHNIVLNSSMAMPNGGTVKVYAKNVRFNCREIEGSDAPNDLRDYVHISITDQGVGIKEEILPRIFDPYFTTRETGHGLGLAVVHSIIRKHKGKIMVKSKEGEFTTVDIFLPASEATREETSPTRTIIRTTGKILAVDDQKEICDMLKRLGKHLGFHIDTALSGAPAMEMFKEALNSEEPYDLLLLDLTIPGEKGGIEILKDMREINPQIKAIATTGYSEVRLVGDLKEAGFVDVIMKPYNVQKLKSMLETLLNSSPNGAEY